MFGSSFGYSIENFVEGLFYSNGKAMAIVGVICLILAVFGGLFLFFWFLPRKNENKFKGFLGWLYKFLNFRTLLAESILRLIYIIIACFVSLYSFGFLFFTSGGSIGGKLLAFLGILILGNALVRLIYEFFMIFLVICKNTSEINIKLGGGTIEQPTISSFKEKNVSNTQDNVQYQQNTVMTQPNQNTNQPEYVMTQQHPVMSQQNPAMNQQNPVMNQQFAGETQNPPAVRFCINCGTQLNANMSKCPNCGFIQ